MSKRDLLDNVGLGIRGEKFFEPFINRNDYHYTWSNDAKIIAEVESL
jgi:hypothetical protein